MAELQAYEEVRPVRRDQMHVYDDIKNVNKIDNVVSSPSWKQYLKMFIMVMSVSLMSAVITYFTVNAQLQQRFDILETKLTGFGKKNKTNLQETENINNLKEQAQLHQKFADIEKKIRETENRHNIKFSDLHKQIKDSTELAQLHQKFAGIEKKIRETENRHNITFSDLHKQIKDSTELVKIPASNKKKQTEICIVPLQVAISAHPVYNKTAQDVQGIIKFEEVNFSVGIDNLLSYKSTGKFVVEKEGLYLISVAVYSTSNDAKYHIYLNGNVISRTLVYYTSSPPSKMYHTGTVVVVKQLRLDDSLWVYYPNRYKIGGGLWSTLTIIKLK